MSAFDTSQVLIKCFCPLHGVLYWKSNTAYLCAWYKTVTVECCVLVLIYSSNLYIYITKMSVLLSRFLRGDDVTHGVNHDHQWRHVRYGTTSSRHVTYIIYVTWWCHQWHHICYVMMSSRHMYVVYVTWWHNTCYVMTSSQHMTYVIDFT